jgi:hypothetical protein
MSACRNDTVSWFLVAVLKKKHYQLVKDLIGCTRQ